MNQRSLSKAANKVLTPGQPGDLVVLKRPFQVAWWSRGGNQDVSGSQVEKRQQIQREGEHVVQRERGHDRFYSGPEVGSRHSNRLHCV